MLYGGHWVPGMKLFGTEADRRRKMLSRPLEGLRNALFGFLVAWPSPMPLIYRIPPLPQITHVVQLGDGPATNHQLMVTPRGSTESITCSDDHRVCAYCPDWQPALEGWRLKPGLVKKYAHMQQTWSDGAVIGPGAVMLDGHVDLYHLLQDGCGMPAEINYPPAGWAP